MNHAGGLRSNHTVVAAKLAARVDDAEQPEQTASAPCVKQLADVSKTPPHSGLASEQKALAVPAMPQTNGLQNAASPATEMRPSAPADVDLKYSQASSPTLRQYIPRKKSIVAQVAVESLQAEKEPIEDHVRVKARAMPLLARCNQGLHEFLPTSERKKVAKYRMKTSVTPSRKSSLALAARRPAPPCAARPDQATEKKSGAIPEPSSRTRLPGPPLPTPLVRIKRMTTCAENSRQ